MRSDFEKWDASFARSGSSLLDTWHPEQYVRRSLCSISLALPWPSAVAQPSYVPSQNPEAFFLESDQPLYRHSVSGVYALDGRVPCPAYDEIHPRQARLLFPRTCTWRSLRASNFIYDVAPRDEPLSPSSTAARIRAIDRTVRCDLRRTKFNMIGSASYEVSACASWLIACVSNFAFDLSFQGAGDRRDRGERRCRATSQDHERAAGDEVQAGARLSRW